MSCPGDREFQVDVPGAVHPDVPVDDERLQLRRHPPSRTAGSTFRKFGRSVLLPRHPGPHQGRASPRGPQALVAHAVDGNQVLFLLLGGMPPNRQGWTNSPMNPFQVPGRRLESRKGAVLRLQSRIASDSERWPLPRSLRHSRTTTSAAGTATTTTTSASSITTAPDGTPNPDPGRIAGMTPGRLRRRAVSRPRAQPGRPVPRSRRQVMNPNGFQIISMGENQVPVAAAPARMESEHCTLAATAVRQRGLRPRGSSSSPASATTPPPDPAATTCRTSTGPAR